MGCFCFLHRWDPRCRLLAALVLAFSFSFVKALHLLPLILGVGFACSVLAGLGPMALFNRLRLPSFIIVAMVIFLPFAGGQTVLLDLGMVSVSREGTHAALLIAARFYAIMMVVFAMIGTMTLEVTINTLKSLGLPPVMADMAGLVLRYFHVIADDHGRMTTAMTLRGYSIKPWSLLSLRTMAWLWGSLFLRSHERSQRVYQAMILRGYHLGRPTGHPFPPWRHLVLLGLVLVVCAFIIFLQLQAGYSHG
ncbi:cobalt transport protein [Desulfurispirillum indicum S5]|uniref:Cobalt transport protein n=1 Tax=Desulfurispirillum indicum (strain ATCC BAA-1389 / DSM 22839 / S5) TaxID=653733 RepID=E6W4Y6_DESIS|nr:cobalt ECF transporter T component CbiQ [Desulfurispirillum indicum]ADU65962.1 cobalt transport protein [Desulfurispirillum indicum S5]